jgi:hypothetical protein
MYEFAQWLETTSISVTIKSVTWIVPMVQSVHIVTIGIVFVSILMIALRVLGQARTDQAFDAVMNRFVPWIRNGLVVLAVTGVTLVVGEPIRELMSLSFWLKMTLLAIGVGGALKFTRAVRAAGATAGQEPRFPASTRTAAVATIMLWLLIIFLGRAIAYDVEVWGSLSLSPRA